MTQIVTTTLVVTPDEPCFNLSEVNLNRIGFKGWRRFQVLVVVRDDRLAQAFIDLGPETDFTAEQFRVPGGVIDDNGRIEILHTVGELRDIADWQRAQIRPAPPLPEAHDLPALYHDNIDQMKRRARHLSQFGEYGRVQRM